MYVDAVRTPFASQKSKPIINCCNVIYFYRFLKETINGLSADILRFINVDLIVAGVFAQGIISYSLSISIIIIFIVRYAHLVPGHALGP